MERRKVHETKVADTRIALFDTDRLANPAPADGVHGFRLEGGNMRMDFFRIAEGSTAEAQNRDVACSVVMPLAQFLHFARSVNHQVMQFAGLAKHREIESSKKDAA